MQRPRLALVSLALCVVSGSAAARDLAGHAALGGQLDSGPLGGALSFKYWVSDLGLQLMFGMDAEHSHDDTADDGTVTHVPGSLTFRPAVRVLYAITRSKLTNLYIGGGFTSILRKSAVDGGNSAYIDVVIGIEFFLGDKFSVGGHVLVSTELAKDPDRILDSAGWGTSFHYYF